MDTIGKTPLNATLGTALLGASLMGSISAQSLPHLLAGKMDKEISIFMYHRQFGKLPEFEEDLKEPGVVEILERFKQLYRSQLQAMFNQLGGSGQSQPEPHREARPYEQRKHLERSKAAYNFKQMSKPAPEGTVDELAKRYGVSKSVIRTMKRENRLHELTAPVE